MKGQQTKRIIRRRWRTAAVTMLLGLIAPHGVDAQLVTAPSQPLSLQDAILMAREREPGLRAERSQVDVALGNLSQASLKPNPTVSLGWQQQPRGADNQSNVTVAWPLDLFRAAGRVGVAEREADVVRLRIADRERLLAADVRAAYGAVAAAQRELHVLEEVTETATRQLDGIRSRVEAGATPALDRDLLVVERRRLDADRLLLDARANSARLTLQRLLGLGPSERVTLRDSLESLVDVPGVPSNSPDVVPQRRPDLQIAEAGVRVADAAIDRAHREGRFDISLFGTYSRMRTMFPQLGVGAGGVLQPVSETFQYLGVGAMLTLPWRNDNRGEIAAAEARRSGAEATLAAVALQAGTEVAAATMQDEQSQAAVALYARDILPLAQQNLDVVRQTYELGRGTLADVLGEQRRYLDIERAYTEALKTAYDARTSLQSAQGVQP